MRLREGSLFDNRYRLRKLLGGGGFSEVWLVEDTRVGNEKRALKVYAPGKGLDDDGVKLFSSEFQLVYDFNHTHLLRPSHFDVCDRSPYLVLPYCERGSAGKLVGDMSEEDAWRFLRDVATGLAYLHGLDPPIIHQDIKPDNVLIDQTGRYLIIDFGISAKTRGTLIKSVGNEKSGGTISYMPPERFGNKNAPIKASDVWALGATLFELLAGDAPFGEHGGLIQKSDAAIPDIGGGYSKDLNNIVKKMLAAETWNRPTAEQLVEWTAERFKGDNIPSENENKPQLRYVAPRDVDKDTKQRFTVPALGRPDPDHKDVGRETQYHVSPTYPRLKTGKGKYTLAAVAAAAVVLGILAINYARQPYDPPPEEPRRTSAPVATPEEQIEPPIEILPPGKITPQKEINIGADARVMEEAAKKVAGQDKSDELSELRKKAKEGDALAQMDLGFMYENGRGVAQSYAEAVNWYRKAADQGNASAQNDLGFMYENGRGVALSYAEAANWYRKAADQGNAHAQRNLGIMYEIGRGVPQSYAEAVNWYRKAADQGYEMAQYNLGFMYENGSGVPQSDNEAANWYRKAADQGNEYAKSALVRLSKK